jgi:hypothetical protein
LNWILALLARRGKILARRVQIDVESSAASLKIRCRACSVSKKDNSQTVTRINRWRFWKLPDCFHLAQTPFWVKKPRFEPRLVCLYINSSESGARKLAVGNGLLRLREEEEQGDQEPQANQTEEWQAGHQGHLCLMWQGNLQDR